MDARVPSRFALRAIARSLTCATLALAACSDAQEPGDPVYTSEVSGLAPALLAVAPVDGTMVAVGGPLAGDAAPSIQVRGEQGWAESSPPTDWRGAIWWLFEEAPGSVWMVGAEAQIARGSLSDLQMISSNTSTSVTFYGVWGASPTDVWIVGADRTAGPGQAGVILRYNGSQLTRVDLTGTASRAADVPLFKVWGSGPNDVFIVGGGGTALHYDGDYTLLDTQSTAQLTTVHGRSATEVYAVGGFNQGEVLRYDGSSWSSVGDPLAPPLSGVFVADDGVVWAAGDGGYLSRYDGSSWEFVDTQAFTQFHAVTVFEGAVFGVGGQLTVSTSPRMGFVGRYGPPEL